MNKKISTPIAIGIILILSVLLGGFTLWQCSEIQKEKIEPTLLENKEQTTDLKETAQNLFSDYLDKYKNTDTTLNDRIKSYIINDIKIDMTEDDCFGFTVNYSVETLKDQNNNLTNWVAGNGKEDGNWVKNKQEFVDAIKENGNYKIREMGTGRGSISCMGEQDETADWKTYSNEEYGFEIKYPEKWPIDEDYNNENYYANVTIREQNGEGKMVDLYIYNNPNNLSLTQWLDFYDQNICGSVGERKPISIAGVEGIKGAHYCGDSYLEGIFLLKENKVYNINFLWGGMEETVGPIKDEEGIYNQMLSTFKFIEETTDNMKNCEIDSDCVGSACCHPDSCINKAYRGVCNVFCTQSCEGPLDCEKGNCACVNNKCVIIAK